MTSSVNWSKERYEEMKNEISRMLRMVGYKIEKINFIPVSGWTGDNLIKKSDKMPWYNGPTLMEAFDLLEVPAKPTNKPLRIPIQDVYSITGIGTVPVGRVETGTLKPGQNLVFMPSNKTAEVKSIEMHHTQIPIAEPGDNIGMNVRGIAKTDVHRGDVAGPADNPPTVAKEFIGQIIVIYHPTAIAAGYTPVLHFHTGQIACRFTELIKKIDPRTGQVTEEHPSLPENRRCSLGKNGATSPNRSRNIHRISRARTLRNQRHGHNSSCRRNKRSNQKGTINPLSFIFCSIIFDLIFS